MAPHLNDSAEAGSAGAAALFVYLRAWTDGGLSSLGAARPGEASNAVLRYTPRSEAFSVDYNAAFNCDHVLA